MVKKWNFNINVNVQSELLYKVSYWKLSLDFWGVIHLNAVHAAHLAGFSVKGFQSIMNESNAFNNSMNGGPLARNQSE